MSATESWEQVVSPCSQKTTDGGELTFTRRRISLICDLYSAADCVLCSVSKDVI